MFMTLEKKITLSFKNSTAFVKAYNVIKIFSIIIFLQGRNKQTRKISSLRNSLFSFPWKIHTLQMKCTCFLFRLQCFLPQFTDIHSANFMLNCISQGYANLHTLCLHKVLQVKSCLLTENDMMTCCCSATSLLSVCARAVVHIKTICPSAYGEALHRGAHGDRQCTHYTEIRVYAFGGKIVSLLSGSSLLPIPEYSIHCSTYNNCLQYVSE